MHHQHQSHRRLGKPAESNAPQGQQASFDAWSFQRAVLASDLKTTSKVVLLSLAVRANDEGVAWPGLLTLAADTSMSKSGVRLALASIGPEWMRVEQGSGNVSTRYYLAFRPTDGGYHDVIRGVSPDDTVDEFSVSRGDTGGITTCYGGYHDVLRGVSPRDTEVPKYPPSEVPKDPPSVSQGEPPPWTWVARCLDTHTPWWAPDGPLPRTLERLLESMAQLDRGQVEAAIAAVGREGRGSHPMPLRSVWARVAPAASEGRRRGSRRAPPPAPLLHEEEELTEGAYGYNPETKKTTRWLGGQWVDQEPTVVEGVRDGWW